MLFLRTAADGFVDAATIVRLFDEKDGDEIRLVAICGNGQEVVWRGRLRLGSSRSARPPWAPVLGQLLAGACPYAGSLSINDRCGGHPALFLPNER